MAVLVQVLPVLEVKDTEFFCTSCNCLLHLTLRNNCGCCSKQPEIVVVHSGDELWLVGSYQLIIYFSNLVEIRV